jgi:hypothetical protein
MDYPLASRLAQSEEIIRKAMGGTSMSADRNYQQPYGGKSDGR